MAWSLTVDSVDIIDYVDVSSIVVEEVSSQEQAHVATLRFNALDATGTISIDTEDAVVLANGATDYFVGKVKTVDDSIRGLTKTWTVSCVDNNVLLDETVIETHTIDDGDNDDTEIDTIFTTYRSDIDATTYVSQLDADMEAVTLDAFTLREALDEIVAQTAGRFYVDMAKNLHYFADSESNAAAFSLSDSPNGTTSFGYSHFRRRRSSTSLAKRFRVLGQAIAGWVTGASYSAGDPEGASRDTRITTADAILARGSSLLDRYENETITYELETTQDGLQAGMDVTLVNSTYSINGSFTIRKIRWTFADLAGAKISYHLYLGSELPSAAAREYQLSLRQARFEQAIATVSDEVFDDNAPAAPTFVIGNLSTGVTEDADGHQVVWIKATWGSVSDSDLDHYEIQIADNTSFNWPVIQHVQAGATREVIFSGLVGGTDHYLRVRSVDWVGNYSAWSPNSPGYLTLTSAADSTAPAQVTGLSAGASRTLIGLSWTANSEADLAYYRIQRADDSGGSPATFVTIAEARLNYYIDQDFTDGEISGEDTFWYRVRAIDTSGNLGTVSANVSATLSRVTTDHIAANTITAANIAADTITASEIAANTITASEIAASTITATEMNISTLSAITANMGTLTAGEIRVGTGTVGSNFTGFRIMSSYLAGYDSDTLQAGIRSSDGRFIAGGGDVVLDDEGIRLDQGAAAPNQVKWARSGTDFASIYGSSGGVAGTLQLAAANVGSGTAYIVLSASSSYSGKSTVIRMDASNQRIDIEDIAGTELFRFEDSVLYINETTGNASMTIGLTINQGANDDEALSIKSSDVAHGATAVTETDTYFRVMKAQASSGGAIVSGHKDADGAQSQAMVLTGTLAEDAATVKTAEGRAIVEILGIQTSGTSVTNTVADGNVLAVRTYRGGEYVTLLIVDEDGDLYYDGSASSYDAENDIALVREMSDILAGSQARSAAGSRAEALGILARDDHGVMVSTKRSQALYRGALLQLDERIRQLEAKR